MGGRHGAEHFVESQDSAAELKGRCRGPGRGDCSLNTIEPPHCCKSGRLFSVVTRRRSSHASSWSGRSLTGFRKRFGGLKPSTQRLLDRVCEGRADVGRRRIPDRRVSAGTVLIREWGGVSHRVRCSTTASSTAAGATFALEVAGVITGARWSGPLFFGLKRRAKKISHG